MPKYLLLPHIRVQTANALACQFIVNASPVMAITQFAHNLIIRHLGCKKVRGVAIRHHHAQHQALEDVDSNVLPHQRRSASLIDKQDYVGKGSHGPTLSAQPTANVDLEVSLLIEYEGLPDESKLTPFLRTGRLAGGNIIDFQQPMNTNTANEALEHLGKNGFWLIERPELIQQGDPLGSAFAAMERRPTSADRTNEPGEQNQTPGQRLPHELSHAWVVPTVLGYQTITEFAEREGVRLQMQPDDSTLKTTPHAYAEPLVGMIQYVATRQWDDGIPYWRQHWLNDQTFVVQCHAHSTL